MEPLILLTFFCIGGFSFTLPNHNTFPINALPNTLLNSLPNNFPKGIFNGMPNGVMNVPAGLRNSLPVLNLSPANSTQGKNNSCCFGEMCFSPCPLAGGGIMPIPPVPMPLPPMPAPMVVPVRTYYEPVVHDHPPLHRIRKIIRQDRERKRKRHRSSAHDSSGDCSWDDISDSTMEDSAPDYYEDFIHVKL